MRRALTTLTLLGVATTLAACSTDEGGEGGGSPTSTATSEPSPSSETTSSPEESSTSPEAPSPSTSAPSPSDSPSTSPSDDSPSPSGSASSPADPSELLAPGERSEHRLKGRANGAPRALRIAPDSVAVTVAGRCEGGSRVTLRPTVTGQTEPVGPAQQLTCDGERHDLQVTADEPFDVLQVLAPGQGTPYEIAVLAPGS
ncbi:hypothetical protein [Kytococcus sp. Marseille-QA3725]